MTDNTDSNPTMPTAPDNSTAGSAVNLGSSGINSAVEPEKIPSGSSDTTPGKSFLDSTAGKILIGAILVGAIATSGGAIFLSLRPSSGNNTTPTATTAVTQAPVDTKLPNQTTTIPGQTVTPTTNVEYLPFSFNLNTNDDPSGYSFAGSMPKVATLKTTIEDSDLDTYTVITTPNSELTFFLNFESSNFHYDNIVVIESQSGKSYRVPDVETPLFYYVTFYFQEDCTGLMGSVEKAPCGTGNYLGATAIQCRVVNSNASEQALAECDNVLKSLKVGVY